MRCSICDKNYPSGGTHLPTREASGICLRCGGAVCTAHGVRDRAGALVCETCALELPATGTLDRPGRLEALSA